MQQVLAQHDPDVLSRVQTQDPKYAEGIDAQISKMARRGTDQYSPNAYDTLVRTLEPNDMDHPNRIASQDHLDRLMGRRDGTGINFKDYHAAKQALDFSENYKKTLLSTMKEIESANGNVDGQGEQRALQFYEFANRVKQNQDPDGKKEAELTSPDSKSYIGNLKQYYMASRETQMFNATKNMARVASTQQAAPRQPGETPDQYLSRTGGL